MLTSTGVGLAYDEGLLKLEDPIVKYLGNHVPEEADPKIREVTVRHLLTQTSGIGQGSLFEADRYLGTGEDWIARVLGRPCRTSRGRCSPTTTGTITCSAVSWRR